MVNCQELTLKENELEILTRDLATKQELVEPNARKAATLSEELLKFQGALDNRLKERNK